MATNTKGSGEPIKIPYNYRPTPTLQLMSKVAKFTGQRKEQMYGAAPPKISAEETVPETKETIAQPLAYEPKFNFAPPPVDPQAKLLDPNYKEKGVETKHPVRNATEHGNQYTAGVVGNLLNPAKASEMDPDPAEYTTGKKIIGTKYANFNIIGGQPPEGDPYKTTAQTFNDGTPASLDNKSGARKKPFNTFDPKQMISPITGELIADYGNWAADYEKAKKGVVEDEEPVVEEDSLMAKLKEQLSRRGAKGIIGLGRVFKIMDDDGSNTLSFAEFKKAMKEFGVALTDADLIMLFKRFDRGNTGSITYNAFLSTVAGRMNNKRRRLVNMAFDVLDKDGSGIVDLTDIAMAYDVSQHPDFKAGKKSKESILREFLDAFDVGGEQDGQVTRDEFINYYSNLSASIARDDYFELMIRNAWHISGGEGAAANSSNTRVLVTREDGSQYVEEIKNDLGITRGDKDMMMSRLKAQGVNAAKISQYDEGEDNKKVPPVAGLKNKPVLTPKTKTPTTPKSSSADTTLAPPGPGIKMLITKIKNEMKARGSGGFIGLQRRFRIMDDDGSKTLNMAEFKKAMRELKLDMTEADLRQLFEYFDTDRSGSIDFEEFIQGVRDPMTERRLKLVNMAFDIIDKDGNGEVDGTEVASMFDASKHPEVLSKHKTAAQVLREFLDTFDVGGVKDGKVTREEFINYYANISASIDNEDYFELMIRNAWHITGGVGNAANSSNMRVLVTDFAGNERRVVLENDLGLKPDDLNGIYNRLTKQGVKDIMAINGKMLKKINVNGVDIVTASGVVSQIIKDENKVNVLKAPTFIRPGQSTAAPRPLSMPVDAGSKIDVPRGNINLIGRNGLVVDNSKGQIASTMYEDLKQKAVVKSKAVAEEIVCSTLLDVLRTQLLSRGPSGIIELQRKFIEMDTDNSKSLDKNEFKQAMTSNKLTFSDAQLSALFDYFDTDKSGTIDYNELLNGLRGELSPRLLVLVHSVFDLMDHEGTNVIDPEQLLTHFDPTRHPDVLTGLGTGDVILKEFLDTFDVGGEQPGKITRDEFVTYYTNIRAAINDDDYFELILRKCWHLKEDFEQNMTALKDYKVNRIAGESSLINRLKQAQQFANSSNNNNALPNPQPSIQGTQAFPPRRPSSVAGSRRPSAGSYNNYNNSNTNQFNSGGKMDYSRPQTASAMYRGGEVKQQQQSSRHAPMADSQVLSELRAIQTKAVQAYNAGDLQEAERGFIEAQTVLHMIYPANHPECIKGDKSLSMVQSKIQSLQKY